MGSINRVIEAHGDELVAEVLASLPTAIRVLQPSISLENNTYALAVTAAFPGPDSTTDYLLLDPYDIDELAERFPDCEVGY
jgi:hypothetical protein